MSKTQKNAGLTPYNILVNDEDNSAVINMYGEVVRTHPLDWWTGEPIPGNFIAQDEFLRDLDELAGKSNITVHINSVGGDLYAGLAIYNRLKGLAANVTTVNDGLAASAGSLIFQAGNTRKMNAGSNLMVHGAAGFLYGYYQIQDLKSAIKQLEAHNKAAINVYAEASGRDAAEIKPLVDRETWLTGADAVSEGFADEVISDEAQPIDMRLTPDKTTMMINGYPVAARCCGQIPDSVPVMTAEEWAEMSTPKNSIEPLNNSMQPDTRADINTHQNGGMENMAEITNMDELRAAHPDLVSQVENAAQAKGIAAERERIQGIAAIESAIGDKDLVNSAKFGENPMTAEELAFAAMKKQAAIGADMLNSLNADAQNSGGVAVESTPAQPETPELSDDEKAEALLIGAAKNMKEGQ